MPSIGMKYPCWAPNTSESTTALPVHGSGLNIGRAVKADLAIAYAEGQFYSDNELSEDVSEFASGSVAMETDNLELSTMAAIYGAELVDGELGNGSTDTPPYGALGYIRVLMIHGVKKYRAFYYPKVKAKMGNESDATKSGSITFGAAPISFTVFQPLFGKWRYVKEFTTEASAQAYIETKLNVATWYAIDVQVNGETTGESATPSGVTMAADGSDFTLTISGTPTALYDNGVDNVASIVDGVYTVSSVAAAHSIAVIF